MNRIEAYEKAFKRRYNRDVEVYQIPSKSKDVSEVKIKYKDNEYILTEYRKNGLTVSALAQIGKKIYKYNQYLHAEIAIADNIGENS